MDLTTLFPSDYALYVGAAISIVAVIMTVLPKPESETGAYAIVYKVLNLIAMNFGKAANKA